MGVNKYQTLILYKFTKIQDLFAKADQSEEGWKIADCQDTNELPTSGTEQKRMIEKM